MEVKELQEYIDKRFDRLEIKIEGIVPVVVTHTEQIRNLRGFNKYVVTVFLGIVGFLAVTFFKKG